MSSASACNDVGFPPGDDAGGVERARPSAPATGNAGATVLHPNAGERSGDAEHFCKVGAAQFPTGPARRERLDPAGANFLCAPCDDVGDAEKKSPAAITLSFDWAPGRDQHIDGRARNPENFREFAAVDDGSHEIGPLNGDGNKKMDFRTMRLADRRGSN